MPSLFKRFRLAWVFAKETNQPEGSSQRPAREPSPIPSLREALHACIGDLRRWEGQGIA